MRQGPVLPWCRPHSIDYHVDVRHIATKHNGDTVLDAVDIYGVMARFGLLLWVEAGCGWTLGTHMEA